MANPPFLANLSPSDLEAGIPQYVAISANVLDQYSILVGSINIYVNDSLIFDGYNFDPLYNGTLNSIAVDEYSGYYFEFTNTDPFGYSDIMRVRVTAENSYSLTLDDYWTFYIKTSIDQIEQGPYEITFDVTFSGAMYEDIELTNSSNYKFSNGAYARKVDLLSNNQVRLWSELTYENQNFSVIISQNIKDSYGMPIDENSTVVPIFYSSANLGSYNGLIRTNHDSYFINSDSQRIYLGGIKGVDIFKRGTNVLLNQTWAQIFDNYGINSMATINYPSDIVISDTQPPYLSYAYPPVSGTAFPDTHILFVITDIATAIEITSLTFYINGSAAFRGNYGGWQDGFSGNIAINYQSLGIDVWPSTNFPADSIVAVRIIASDLVGNQMDYSYTFEIISLSATGWGISAWGISSFGGV